MPTVFWPLIVLRVICFSIMYAKYWARNKQAFKSRTILRNMAIIHIRFVTFESHLFAENNVCAPIITVYALVYVQFAAYTTISHMHTWQFSFAHGRSHKNCHISHGGHLTNSFGVTEASVKGN